MNVNVVLIRKVRSSRSTWEYIAGDDKGTLTVKDEDVLFQLATLVDTFSAVYDGKVAIVSPQLVKRVHRNLMELYPEVPFIPLMPQLMRMFDRAFAQSAPRRRRVNTSTLYVCSDASGGHMNVPAAWAWCSGGAKGDYGVGFSGNVNTNVAELEGLMSAIVANGQHSANRLHFYSDSMNAIDDVVLLQQGKLPRAIAEYDMWDLAGQTSEVLKERNITLEWLKGHRYHRLNSMADNISRFARERFVAGQNVEDFTPEITALYAMLDHNA